MNIRLMLKMTRYRIRRLRKQPKKRRCCICSLAFRTWKTLGHHYFSKHSKNRLIKLILAVAKTNVSRRHTRKIVIEMDDNDHELIVEITNGKKVEQKVFMHRTGRDCVVEHLKPNEKLVFFPRVAKTKKDPKPNEELYKKVTRTDPTSLNYKTGHFYVCRCGKEQDDVVTVSSDTESSSENGTQRQTAPRYFYCKHCGNGYRTRTKLKDHEKIHKMVCQICKQFFPSALQLRKHLTKHYCVYMCHICRSYFHESNTLLAHLDWHRNHEIQKTILDLEDNYTHYVFNYNREPKDNVLNNITTFLMQSCDEYKVTCSYCGYKISQTHLANHIKMHYFIDGSKHFFSPQN